MLNDIFNRAEPILNHLKHEDDILENIAQIYDNHQKKEKPLEVYLERLSGVHSGRILMISESWCSDCVIQYAVMRWLAEECPQIDVRVIARTGLEEVVKQQVGRDQAKIPCIIVLDDKGNSKGTFVERPKSIRELETSDDQMKRISLMRGYREGLFLWETLEELIDYLEA